MATEATGWLGRRVTYDPFDVTRIDIAKFARSIGSLNPSHLEPAEARRLGFPDVVAPLGYYTVIRHTMANLVALDELTIDGMSADLTPPTKYRRRIAAESRVWFHDRIVAGDSIILTRTLASMADKEGRSGPFTSVTYRLDFHKSDGRLAVVEDFVRILR